MKVRVHTGGQMFRRFRSEEENTQAMAIRAELEGQDTFCLCALFCGVVTERVREHLSAGEGSAERKKS
nr:hypothetical protein [Clostridia bacterium]